METEGSSLCSQQPATGSYPEHLVHWKLLLEVPNSYSRPRGRQTKRCIQNVVRN